MLPKTGRLSEPRPAGLVDLTPRLASLPTPPDRCEWSKKVLAAHDGAGFPMYGNDKYGDCTIAGAGHQEEVWSANATAVDRPNPQELLNTYFKLTGGADTGLYLSTVVDYWKQTGIAGHKVDAAGFVDASNLTAVMLAIYYFGGIYWALDLPNAVYNSNIDVLTAVWDLDGPATGDWAPNPNQGHCVIVPDYVREGPGGEPDFVVVTWGEVKPMNAAFFQAMNSVAYVLVSKQWMEVAGISPAGFDIDQLIADLNQVAP